MRRTLLLIIAIALVDWTLKGLILAFFPEGAFREVLPGRVALFHVQNHEMMLGLWGWYSLEVRRAIALGAGLLALLALVRALRVLEDEAPEGRSGYAWALGLLFGGILGNLGERAVHWSVTDYLSLQIMGIWMPPGNVADLALFAAIPATICLAVREARTGRAFSWQKRRIPA